MTVAYRVDLVVPRLRACLSKSELGVVIRMGLCYFQLAGRLPAISRRYCELRKGLLKTADHLHSGVFGPALIGCLRPEATLRNCLSFARTPHDQQLNIASGEPDCRFIAIVDEQEILCAQGRKCPQNENE